MIKLCLISIHVGVQHILIKWGNISKITAIVVWLLKFCLLLFISFLLICMFSHSQNILRINSYPLITKGIISEKVKEIDHIGRVTNICFLFFVLQGKLSRIAHSFLCDPTEYHTFFYFMLVIQDYVYMFHISASLLKKGCRK